ncbi:methyltransferase [Calothrix sp. HK-06]|nr:methyltransferase [Calothrix sp. HK-06]
MSINSQVLEIGVVDELPYIEANLHYLIPMPEKPVIYIDEPPPGIPRYNGKYEAYKLPIRNARLIKRNLSLDQEGFTFVNHHSAVSNFYDDNEIRRVYYPEAEQLLLKATGATKVIVFDHNVRNTLRSQQNQNNVREPVKRVHNDFTAKSGYSRARLVLEALKIEDAEALLQRRFSIVNVWRPIAEPVQEDPLAICDAKSMAKTDLVASDLVYRNRVGETYGITYNPTHQWFYFPQMQKHEVVLIKCFDSSEDIDARFTAHTAFEDPTSLPDAPPRESIELRTLVFY